MAMPVISVEKKEISYNESANYSWKEISDGTKLS
jgi:hypothetical protein